VTGGLTNTPQDFQRLSRALEATLHVVDNPLYLGKVQTGNLRQDEEVVACIMARIAIEQNCKGLIGHSRGGIVTLLAARHMKDEHDVDLDNIILISPPSASNWSPDGYRRTDDEPGVLNAVLTGLTKTMTDTIFREMFRRHAVVYGKNFQKTQRKISPGKEPISVEHINNLVNTFHGNLLLVVGSRDPWHDPKRLKAMHRPKKNVETVYIADTSHFPHIEAPQEVAQAIHDWQG
jgi:pimeloyl-ACP methyl ester carboxylesterase